MSDTFIEYLINSRLIDESRLKLLRGKPLASEGLYMTLVRENLIAEEALARAAGAFYKRSVIDIAQIQPNANSLNCANMAFCIKYMFLPFGEDSSGRSLRIAVADMDQSEEGLALLRKEVHYVQFVIYVAPVVSLYDAIIRSYGNERRSRTLAAGSKEASPAAFRTHYGLEIPVDSNGKSGSIHLGLRESLRTGVGLPDPMMPSDSVELDALRRENAELRQEIKVLKKSFDLEVAMVRKFMELLLQQGVIQKEAYMRWVQNLK